MVIEGFRAGWRAGVGDTTATATVAQDLRGGDVAGAGQVVADVVNQASNAVQGGLQRLVAGVVSFGAEVLSAVGAEGMARGARAAASDIQVVRYEGRAQFNLQSFCFHVKRAWTAACRAYGDDRIKGLGKLSFSVASWGANSKEAIKDIFCAIGNGFKSLRERIKSLF